MFYFLLNYKFYVGFIVVMLMLLLYYDSNTKFVKSNNEFLFSISEMFSNFEKIKHAFNKGLYQNLECKNLEYNNLVSAENELKTEESNSKKKHLFYSKLENLGFIDVYNSWPKNTLEKIYEDKNKNIKITKEQLDIIKNYFCFVKKFFNQCKGYNLKNRKSESEFQIQVNKCIDLLISMSMQPTMNLLINLLNFFKNCEDNTYEYEREFIIRSTT